MKKIDLVWNYITNTVSYNYIINNINKDTLGISAREIENSLNIIRNNASTILNQLWKNNKLIKINTRPVKFIPRYAIENLLGDSSTVKNQYSLDEFKELIKSYKNKDKDPFQSLLGHDSSLKNEIGQAKAAIMYPPNGLHTLLLGESGVGKTTFAYAMYQYGKLFQESKGKDFPFVSFNCSDYFNNPQLLMSELFGHIKGAFTGADQDKVGLVEKANGGILFLDEVHRLPPDGQEMLFYLMDKNEYHKLGESQKRKSNILVIAATTEEPDSILLPTFLRRIPVTITLPPLRNKKIDERVEFVESLFYFESVKLNMKISVSPEVLKVLSIYDFKSGNIGQLKSEIKLLCAKAYLRYLQNNTPLFIEFKMLNEEIRNCIFSYNSLPKETKNYLDIFNDNLIISPENRKIYHPDNLNINIYNIIDSELEHLKGKHLNKQQINLKINSIIEDKFKNIINNFKENRLNIQQLYKLLPREVVDVSQESIVIAQEMLNVKFKNEFIFAFAFHINALLNRLNENKKIESPNMIKVKGDYTNEFAVSKKIADIINKKFAVSIPENEKGFLSILLGNNTHKYNTKDTIGIIVICHGNSTAKSMANVANSLLNTDLVKGIDMPLDAKIEETYIKVKSTAIALNKKKGILLLVDMGSLKDFGERIMNETGIKIKVIDNVSTLLVIESLRQVLYKEDSIDNIYNILSNNFKNVNKEILTKKGKAILTLCATGKGSSMVAKKLLYSLIPDKYKNEVTIITTTYINLDKTISELTKKYDLIACIGTIHPKINIPYFPINKLLDTGFKNQFIKFLDMNINTIVPNLNDTKSIYEISKEMLEEYVKFINPKLAVINIRKFIKNLDLKYDNNSKDYFVDLIVHMECMLDRCIQKNMLNLRIHMILKLKTNYNS
ncbi:sigma 54-interacting transcriptional regulator [Clostridium sp. cel8]|uniref:sigma-54-dependent transcriptional regulator n=1 Tax=Clostridium sp. cel8 TaxID=2663123 RepID=UPI0015F6266E|nr:sigma-54-dependent transcriptional regulator [Clostridium sp. cel8]MBA5850952.1 sigma 54-interacting transcriptional regulator [Clostridium sp. cel8]